MKRCEKEGLIWYEFDLLADIPNLKHATLTRHGGVSSAPFDTLNVSFEVDDEREKVAKNRQRICEIIGFPNLVDAHQNHGINAAKITSLPQQELKGFDTLTTDQADVPIMVKHADCQALILYDPKRPAVATVHAGWKGNVQNIFQHTVAFMKKEYHSKPDNLIACVSPSLGPKYAEFVNYREEFPEDLWSFRKEENLFDLWEIAEKQLLDAGLLPHHIEIARICTYSTPEDFFSFRRDRVTGRHGTIAMLTRP